jgi:zinc/manganese transport system permease protein
LAAGLAVAVLAGWRRAAIAARRWSDSLAEQVRVAVLLACLASVGGLALSPNLDMPAPAIVLAEGAPWLLSPVTVPRASL